MSREMICISCPIGCHLTVEQEGDEITVQGNKCPRGAIYGREEILAPTRVVTATVRITGARDISRLPVKSTKGVPKEKVAHLLNRLYQMELQSPVERGAPVIQDFEGTGIDVVATRSL